MANIQVYKRVANPYMPNGTPDLTNAPSPYYAPGELGYAFNDPNTGNSYLRVQLDSGATSATPVGAVLAGQLAYWKNYSTATVTNDSRMCDLGATAAVNRVAGIFGLAVTTAPGINGTDGQPLLYMCDLVIQAQAYPIQVTGSIVKGGYATADTTANTARAIASAVGTAPPTQPLGIFTSTTVTSGTSPCDVNIAFVD
jgi:hypothetical protein